MSVCLSVRHTFALSPNSSETAWNFQTPFYRIEAGRLRMVYVNFHKPICPRDFSITIYYFYWVWPTKSIRSQIMRLSINLRDGPQALLHLLNLLKIN